jgi:hypothetical protein
MKAFASREHPEVTASYIDFSKPIDDKANVQANADPEHELLTFESHCYACSAPGGGAHVSSYNSVFQGNHYHGV